MTSAIRHAAATDIGLAREANEDSYLADPPLFLVADGMGGHMAGDVASRMAVESIVRELARNPGALADAVIQANRDVHNRAAARPELRGMGTTLTAMMTAPDGVDIVHIGDSRAYLLRNGSLTRLTRDHTVVERLVREGRIGPEEAEHHPKRSYLERALGVEPQVEIDSYKVATQQGDRILLCTDGLTTMLSEDEILQILVTERDPKRASRELVAAAVAAGGNDNVTVVVVDYPGQAGEGPEPSAQQTRAVRSPNVLRPNWRRRALRTSIVAIAVLLAVFVAVRALTLSRWYVGSSDGKVTIYRGVPWFIHKVDRRSDIPVSALPEVYRDELAEGIRADDRGDAEYRVSKLREIQAEHGSAVSPNPTPSPSVGSGAVR